MARLTIERLTKRYGEFRALDDVSLDVADGELIAILGASYQLIPIVLERPVWSERLGRWELVAITLGVVGIVGHVAIASWSGLVWSAALVAVGVTLHVVNTALTLRGLERWSFTGTTEH